MIKGSRTVIIRSGCLRFTVLVSTLDTANFWFGADYSNELKIFHSPLVWEGASAALQTSALKMHVYVTFLSTYPARNHREGHFSP